MKSSCVIIFLPPAYQEQSTNYNRLNLLSAVYSNNNHIL